MKKLSQRKTRLKQLKSKYLQGSCFQAPAIFIIYLFKIMSNNPLLNFTQGFYPENIESQKTFLTEEKREQGNSQGGLAKREWKKSFDCQSVSARQNFIVAKEEFGKRLQRMYKFPASVNEAKVHKRAFRNGYKSSKSYIQIDGKLEEKDTQICPCCQNFVNTNEIPYCYGTYPKELDDVKHKNFFEFILGYKIRAENVFQIQSGDALFFCFIKLVITYLIIRFLLLDVYNLFTNSLGHYCRDFENSVGEKICVNGFFSVLSTANKNTIADQDYFFLYDILAFAFTVFSIFFFLYGRIKLLELHELLENWEITEDDYTILIEEIPHIPFEKNDTLVKDLNLEYKDYLSKIVSRKVRAWLNQLYSYNSKDEIQDPMDQEFFHSFNQHLKQNQSRLFDEIVTSVNLCYDLSELENLEDIREKLVQEFLEQKGNKDALQNSLFEENYREEGRDADMQNKKGRIYISYLPHQIEIINKHYVKACQMISETEPLGESLELSNDEAIKIEREKREKRNSVDELKISRFVGKAFVSLRFQHYKKYLLNQFAHDKDYLRTNGNTVSLKLSGAQKPNDIYWKNMKIEDAFRTQQIISSYIIVLITVSASFFIIYHLRTLESFFNSQSNKKTIFQSLYLMTLPIATFIINILLDWGLQILTKFERHKTKTEELSSLVIKNVFAKFMNTTVVYAFVYLSGSRQNPLAENGLVSILMSLIIVGGPLNMGSQILQPYVYYNRWWPNRKYEGVKKANIFQIQLNKKLEDPPFDFAQSYSYYLQMVYLISFYGYMIPLATPIILVYFIFQYWIDKYNLLRRFSSPVDMGYFLTNSIWKAFQFSILFRALGHFVWGSRVHHEFYLSCYVCNFVSLILTVVYLSLSYSNSLTSSTVFKRLVEDSDLCNQEYKKAFSKFKKTYKTQNPATTFLGSDKDGRYIYINIIEQLVKGIYAEGEIIKREQHFVSEQEVQLERIWKNPEDVTVKYLEINDNQKKKLVDFSTLGCCC